MTKVFVAYAWRNRNGVLRLVEEVESRNSALEIWFGERMILPGEDPERRVRQALSGADLLLLCASPATAPDQEGGVFAQERRDASRRLQTDPRFQVVNVILRHPGYIPKPFRSYPRFNLGSKQAWDRNIQALTDRLGGR